MHLAESIEPNADAMSWTLRLRPDATLHDGAPVRAADAAFSLRALATSPFYGQFLADIDVAALQVRDDRTLELPLLRPRADLVEGALAIGIAVFPEDTLDFTAPVGSGPFRVRSFEPARSTVLAAYPDHWAGAPLVDEVEILTIAEAAARLDAVRSGELDIAMRVTAAGALAAGFEAADVRWNEFGWAAPATR